jgi:hypothetical protein
MASKKKVAKKSISDTPSLPNKRSKKLLGVDVRDIGAAIATAVVAELTQAALNRIAKSGDQDAATADNSDFDSNSSDDDSTPIARRTQGSLGNTADTVKESVTDSAAAQIITNAVKNVISEIKPMLAEAATKVKEAPDTATEAVEAGSNQAKMVSQKTAQTVGSAVTPIVEAMQNRARAVKDTVNGVTESATSVITDNNEDSKPKRKKSKKDKAKSKKKKNKK